MANIALLGTGSVTVQTFPSPNNRRAHLSELGPAKGRMIQLLVQRSDAFLEGRTDPKCKIFTYQNQMKIACNKNDLYSCNNIVVPAPIPADSLLQYDPSLKKYALEHWCWARLLMLPNKCSSKHVESLRQATLCYLQRNCKR